LRAFCEDSKLDTEIYRRGNHHSRELSATDYAYSKSHQSRLLTPPPPFCAPVGLESIEVTAHQP
jgi:hypothetical protein